MTKKNYIQPRLDIAVTAPYATLMGTSPIRQVKPDYGGVEQF